MLRFLESGISAIRRRIEHRRLFASGRDWSISLYDSLVRYAGGRRLPLARKTVPLRMRGMDRPLYLRVGSSDGFVLEEIFITGVYDCVTSHDMGQVRLILDLGANAGYSVRLWQKHYPEARIIAVEPDADNARLCRLNAEDGSGLVQVIEAFAAGRSGWGFLDSSITRECSFKMSREPNAGGAGIPAMTVPQILESAGASGQIDLLKCDIEGAESEVFADCSSWLGRVRHLMIELHPPYSPGDLLGDLARAGGRFTTVWSGVTAGNELLFLSRC